MKVLLDTNIIIKRESNYTGDYSIATLYRWIEKLHFDKVIHPATKQEMMNYRDEKYVKNMLIKLSSYNELVVTEKYDNKFNNVIKQYSKRPSDIRDNSILFQVYIGRVNYLITEDKLIYKKATKLGIAEKVYSINSFITQCRDRHPDLLEYKELPIVRTKLGTLNFEDTFFDSFKNDYIEFHKWLQEKSQEEVYVTHDDGKIVGLMFTKLENESESYQNIEPVFLPKRRLKIRTFKVEATGLRLGERMLKIAFDNALRYSVDEIYVTLFDHTDKLITLRDFLSKWGYNVHGIKTTRNGNEIVMVKQIRNYDESKDPRFNYPLIKDNPQIFILPIEPEYHTDLFPESILTTEESNPSFSAHRFAVQKIYISGADPSRVNPGDLIVIYRKGDRFPKKYSSVVSTLCIVDAIEYPRDVNEMIKICNNRSVFTKSEIHGFWPQYNKIIKILDIKPLQKRLNLDKLQAQGIVDPPKGPRPFHKLSRDEFEWILRESETQL